MMLHNDGDKVIPRLTGAHIKVSGPVPMPMVDPKNRTLQPQPRPPSIRNNQIAAAPQNKKRSSVGLRVRNRFEYFRRAQRLPKKPGRTTNAKRGERRQQNIFLDLHWGTS